MNHLIKIIITVLVLGSNICQAQEKTVIQQCFQEISPKPYAYCINRVEGSKSNTLIYHFHGRDLNEKIWSSPTYYTGMIQKAWKEMGVEFPTVVTISFGPLWLLSSKGEMSRDGQREVFLDHIIPEVESKIALKNPERILLGESMGGVNVLQLLDNPKHEFVKVASLCPPIYDISYPLSLSQLRGLVRRTGMEYKQAFTLWWIHRQFIKNEEDWESISLLEKLNKLDAANAPELYLSCGLIDQYGNFEGSEKFYQIARSKNLKVHWHPLYARHCGVDVQSLAAFLVQPAPQARLAEEEGRAN